MITRKNYHTLASTLDAAECLTDSIRQVGSNMQLSHPAGLTIDVECINGEWFIYNVSARAPR